MMDVGIVEHDLPPAAQRAPAVGLAFHEAIDDATLEVFRSWTFRQLEAGIAVALGEIEMPRAEQICKDLDLYSSVASCSSGVELTQTQIVLLGNKAGAGGRYRIGHAVMRDALDIDGIYDSIRNAGIELPERPRAEDLKGRVVNCFMKCEADRRGLLRGRRQIMLDDSDVHHHRHSKAAVGGVAATAIGDPAVFVSVDAMHQGPHGGGPVIAIVELDA